MAKLLIACYSFPSNTQYGKPYVDVVKKLRTAVAAVDKERATQSGRLETANAFQAIFAAPEYMFTGTNTTQKRQPMSKAEREDLLRDLKGISKDYPNILMFCGTIFYQESLQSDFAFNKFRANLLAAELNTTKKIGLAADRRRDVSDAVTDGWTAPGGAYVPSMVTLAKETNRNSFRAYNTLHAYLGGQPAMEPYAKQWDFKETDGAAANTTAYVPGSAAGAASIHKFEFGFEICFDHQNGALKAKTNDVDFHVLVSDSVGNQKPNMAMKGGGYFLHACSEPSSSAAYSRSGNGVLPSKVSLSSGKLETDSLAFWLVEVEQRADTLVTPEAVVTPGATNFTVGTKTMVGVKLPAFPVK